MSITAELLKNVLLKKFVLFLGLVIVVFLAGSWVGAQQFAKSAVTSANFTAPYITTWFGTCWMVFCFPVYCIFGFIFLSRDEFLEAYK